MNKIINKLKEAKKRKQRQTVEMKRINKAIETFKSVKRLENGTVIESTDWKHGSSAFLVSGGDIENGNRIALPVGKYNMADGKVLIVKPEGVVFSYLKSKKK